MHQSVNRARRFEDLCHPIAHGAAHGGDTASFIGNLGSGAVLIVSRPRGKQRVEMQVVGAATDAELAELQRLAQETDSRFVTVIRAGSRGR